MRQTIYVVFLLVVILGSGCVSQKETVSDVNLDVTSKTPIETQPPQEAIVEPPTETTPAPIIEEPPPVEHVNINYTANLDEKYRTCLRCHGDVKSFHNPEAISIIDERKGPNT